MAGRLRPWQVPLTALARIDRAAALRAPHSVTLRDFEDQMLKKARTAQPEAFVREARWLQEELPLRMAGLLVDFNRLPFIALRCESLAEVWSIYWQEFEILSSWPRIGNGDQVLKFKEELVLSQERRSGIIATARQAVGELQRFPDVRESLETFLNRAFLTRIDRLLLEDHFIAFVDHAVSPASAAGGLPQSDGIVSEMRLLPLLESVADAICDLAEHVYGRRPEVRVAQTGEGVVHNIPRYLFFIFQEILKNAVKATVERHSTATHVPPVQVHIITGTYDVQVKISDRGGGMPRQVLKNIWRYGYSGFELSHPKRETATGVMDGGHGSHSQTELSGYGVGLPLSRLYARYLGGDIQVSQVLGHGTEASIILSRHGAREEFSVGDADDGQEAQSSGLPQGRESVYAPL